MKKNYVIFRHTDGALIAAEERFGHDQKFWRIEEQSFTIEQLNVLGWELVDEDELSENDIFWNEGERQYDEGKGQ